MTTVGSSDLLVTGGDAGMAATTVGVMTIVADPISVAAKVPAVSGLDAGSLAMAPATA